MKIRKRIRSAVVALLLTVSAVPCSAAGIKTGETAQQRMLNFNIIREALPETDNVTLAEHSAMLVRAMGLEDAAQSQIGETWESGYIELSKTLRLYDSLSKTFAPGEVINVKTAVVMTVAALGYDVTAPKNEDAQYSVGIKQGLYKNVSAAADAPLTRADAYAIIDNAINTDLCVNEDYTGRYYVEKGNTLLNLLMKNLDRRYGEGILEAAYGVSITGSDVKKGEAMIDGTIYYTGAADVQALVGNRVSFYADYENNAGKGTIKWISPHRNNAAVTLAAGGEKTISAQRLTYYPQGGAKETYNIDSAPLVMYNNRPLGSPIGGMNLSESRVTLTDFDGDDVYDAVTILSIESYIVKSFYSQSGLMTFEKSNVYGKNSAELKDDDDDYVYAVFDQDGAPADTSVIKMGVSVSVAVSADEKYTAVYLNPKPVEGTVTSYSLSDKTAQISEKEYTLVNGFTDVSTDTDGIYYIDCWGRIFDRQDGKQSYVYICGVGDLGGASQRAVIKTFTREEGFKTYEMDKSVVIDGVRTTSSGAGALLINERPAYLTVSTNGKVRKVEYAQIYGEKGVRTYVENDFGFTDYSDKVLTPFACDKSQTAVFFVPKSGIEDEYFNTFPLENDEDYTVTGYDYDERSGKVGALLVEMDVQQPTKLGFGSSAKYLAVNSVKQIFGKTEDTYRVTGIMNGEECELDAAQSQSVFNVMSTLKRGDVVQLVLNWDGEVGLMRKVMDYSALSASFYDTTDYEGTKLFAPVKKVNAEIMTNLRKYLVNEIICYVSGSGDVKTIVPSSLESVKDTDNKGFKNYFVYDAEKKLYTAGGVDSIVSEEYDAANPSEIFVFSQNATVKFIAVIRD